jgi:hypothetical protein
MRRSHRRFRSAVDAVGRQKKSSVSVTPHLFGARARSLRRLDHGWLSITIASRGEAASDERGPWPDPPNHRAGRKFSRFGSFGRQGDCPRPSTAHRTRGACTSCLTGAAVAARRNANPTTAVLVNIASEHPSPARRQSGDKYADWK